VHGFRVAGAAALVVAGLVTVPGGAAHAEEHGTARAHVSGGCNVAPGDHDVTSDAGPASSSTRGCRRNLSAFADPATQSAKAFGKVRWNDGVDQTPSGDACRVDADFVNG
jgi:hypothetical protein